MNNVRVGIVGASDIAFDHARGAIAAGFSVAFAISRSMSERLRRFETEFNARVGLAGNFGKLLEEVNPEVLVLAIPPSEVPAYIDFLRQDVWKGIVLLEKPGAVDSETLKSYSRKLGEIQLYVAYNRRFYSSFASFKQSLPEDASMFFDVVIGEAARGQRDSFAEKALKICTNSVHILDLLLSIDRNMIQAKVRTLRTLDENFLLCELSTDMNTFRLLFAFGQPVLSSVQAFCDGHLHRLQPIEQYQRFNGIASVEPDAGAPIRRYFLREDEDALVSDDGSLKPGFAMMWRGVAQRLSPESLGFQAASLCTLDEAIDVLLLAEAIVFDAIRNTK